MSDPILRCACGTLRGHVGQPAAAMNAICYCRDCQAFAHALGDPRGMLDPAGGTRIVATLPMHVHFDAGMEALACLSLSPKGLLRWYAQCCKTPIGNTPRDFRIPYVGLVHSGLGDPQALDTTFGPARMHLYTAAATGYVAATTLSNVLGMARLMTKVLPARLSGRYRSNPFFDAATGEPIRRPSALA